MTATQPPAVTVIVPTTAQASRAAEIKRCIESIRRSCSTPLVILVVVNGARFDAAVVAWLHSQADLQIEQIETPSAPNAVWHGRKLVQTRYFSTLDDDDEYLPDSTDMKLAAMQSRDADLVVANYWVCRDGQESLAHAELASAQDAPLERLFQANWLHNGNALYRTAAVSTDYFADYWPYAEWTWLAFRIAMDQRKIVFLDAPAFRYHFTPGSLSQSLDYKESYIPLFQRMLARHPPPQVARILRRKLSAAFHSRSERLAQQGAFGAAWRAHLRSIFMAGGLRYLPFTRHLVRRKVATG